MTELLAGRPGFDSRQEQGFFSLRHRVQTGSGVHPASCPMGTGGSFPEGKTAGAYSRPLTCIVVPRLTMKHELLHILRTSKFAFGAGMNKCRPVFRYWLSRPGYTITAAASLLSSVHQHLTAFVIIKEVSCSLPARRGGSIHETYSRSTYTLPWAPNPGGWGR